MRALRGSTTLTRRERRDGAVRGARLCAAWHMKCNSARPATRRVRAHVTRRPHLVPLRVAGPFHSGHAPHARRPGAASRLPLHTSTHPQTPPLALVHARARCRSTCSAPTPFGILARPHRAATYSCPSARFSPRRDDFLRFYRFTRFYPFMRPCNDSRRLAGTSALASSSTGRCSMGTPARRSRPF